MDQLTAPIFDIQRFSIHDGPGIRTLVFFKGCNLHCAWCQNPESQDVEPVVAFYADRCRDAFDCLKSCPQDAINRDGFRINYSKCDTCLACVEACPHSALQLIGEHMAPEDLFEKLLADLPYYQSSGGGVTFSGGEPTLYPKFIDRVLDLCNDRNIHTAMETCGTFSHDRWSSILPKLDLIYFDLKIMDARRHEEATGRGNQTILANARALVEAGLPVEFRIPLIEGFTDDLENLQAIADFMTSLNRNQLHLLSYHNMGETKIDIINGSQNKLGLKTCDGERFGQIRTWFTSRGIEVFD